MMQRRPERALVRGRRVGVAEQEIGWGRPAAAQRVRTHSSGLSSGCRAGIHSHEGRSGPSGRGSWDACGAWVRVFLNHKTGFPIARPNACRQNGSAMKRDEKGVRETGTADTLSQFLASGRGRSRQRPTAAGLQDFCKSQRQARQASQAANGSASVSGEKGRRQLSILGLADLFADFSPVVPADAAA